MIDKKDEKVKKSIDFTSKNIKKLDKSKDIYKFSSNSEVVNSLINLFLGLEPSVKNSLATICKSEYERLNIESINSEPFEWIEKQKIQKQYRDLMEFFYG